MSESEREALREAAVDDMNPDIARLAEYDRAALSPGPEPDPPRYAEATPDFIRANPDWQGEGIIIERRHGDRRSPGPEPVASEGFIGHKPLSNGKCEHRWRNRTTHIVTCGYADGWHAGYVAALSPGPEPVACMSPDSHDEWVSDHRACGCDGPPSEPVAGLREAAQAAVDAYFDPKGGVLNLAMPRLRAALGEKP